MHSMASISLAQTAYGESGRGQLHRHGRHRLVAPRQRHGLVTTRRRRTTPSAGPRLPRKNVISANSSYGLVIFAPHDGQRRRGQLHRDRLQRPGPWVTGSGVRIVISTGGNRLAEPRRHTTHLRQQPVRRRDQRERLDRQPGRGQLIGTDAAGTDCAGQYEDNGVNITVGNASGNTIGGDHGRQGQRDRGRRLPASSVDIARGHNLVPGNLIGTDSTGQGGLGIPVQRRPDPRQSIGNTIGGTTAAAANVISGNASDGVDIDNGTSDNVVEGNYIGTDASGTMGLGNSDGSESGRRHRQHDRRDRRRRRQHDRGQRRAGIGITDSGTRATWSRATSSAPTQRRARPGQGADGRRSSGRLHRQHDRRDHRRRRQHDLGQRRAAWTSSTPGRRATWSRGTSSAPTPAAPPAWATPRWPDIVSGATGNTIGGTTTGAANTIASNGGGGGKIASELRDVGQRRRGQLHRHQRQQRDGPGQLG